MQTKLASDSEISWLLSPKGRCALEEDEGLDIWKLVLWVISAEAAHGTIFSCLFICSLSFRSHSWVACTPVWSSEVSVLLVLSGHHVACPGNSNC